MNDVHEIRYIPFETLVALIIYYILFLIRFRGARGRKTVTTHMFVSTVSFHILWGRADKRLHQDTLLESAVLIKRKQYFFLKRIFSLKITKINFLWTLCLARTQKLTLLEEAFDHRTIKKITFFLSCWPPKCRLPYHHLRRFRTL